MTLRPDVATISVHPETKRRLGRLRALDGEERWDHLLNRAAEVLEKQGRLEKGQTRFA